MVKLIRKRAGMVAVFVGTAVVPALVQAQVTLPTTGVDPEDYIAALMVLMGGVIAAVIGGYFAILGVKKLMSWGGKVG